MDSKPIQGHSQNHNYIPEDESKSGLSRDLSEVSETTDTLRDTAFDNVTNFLARRPNSPSLRDRATLRKGPEKSNSIYKETVGRKEFSKRAADLNPKTREEPQSGHPTSKKRKI